MVDFCETVGDASFYRHAGCFRAEEDCPIKDKKDEFENPFKFFAEQKLDARTRIQDEVFDFNNSASSIPGDGAAASSRAHEQNIHDGHYRGDDWISQNPSAAKNEKAERCQENGGKLAGVGPSCEIDQRGKGDMHQCIFDKVKECESDRQDCLAQLEYESMSLTFVSAAADVTEPPARRPESCDEAFKTCKEKETKDCVCTDCVFGPFCISNCEDENTDGPLDGANDYSGDDPGTSVFEDTPDLFQQRFTTSTYDIPIPVIFGNYITTGNIIWSGNTRTTVVNEREEIPDLDVTRIYESPSRIFHGDFALAIAEGEIDGLVRVWFGDALLFQRQLNVNDSDEVEPIDGILVDEIENMALFSTNGTDIDFYDNSKMKITLFPGTEDQVAPEAMGTNSTAYRGLAYLLFENVNMSYINGAIPEIRVEVATVDQTAFIPYQSVEITADKLSEVSDGDLLWADTRTDTLYVSAGPESPETRSGIHRFRLGTLEQLNEIRRDDKSIDGTTFQLLGNGIAVFQGITGPDQREVTVYNPEFDIELDRFGTDGSSTSGAIHEFLTWGQTHRASLPFHGYAFGESFGFDKRLLSGSWLAAVTPVGGFRASRFNNKTQTMFDEGFFFEGGTAGGGGGDDCFDDCMCDCVEGEGGTFEKCEEICTPFCAGSVATEHFPFASIETDEFYTVADEVADITYNRTYIDVFGFPAGAPLDINVRRFLIKDTGESVTKGTIFPVSIFDSEVIIPTAAWGGVTTGVEGLFVIDDRPRRSAIVFLRNTATDVGYIFSVSTLDYTTINWSIEHPGFPEFVSPGPRMLRYPSSEYIFIDKNDEIVELNLSTGEKTILGNVVDEGFLPITGPQVYDPARQSVTWLDDNFIERIYPKRTSVDPLSLGDLITQVSLRAGLLISEINTTDIDATFVKGVGFFGNVKPRDIIQQLMEMFCLVSWEQDGVLYFAQQGAGTTHAINETAFVQVQEGTTYERIDVDDFVEPQNFTLEYADLNNMARPTFQSISHQITPDNALGSIGHVKYSTPVAMEDATAFSAAELMHAKLHVKADEIDFVIATNRMEYIVNDNVTITFDDGTVITYVIYEMTTDVNLGMSHIKARRDVTNLIAENVSATAYADPSRFRVQYQFKKLEPYRLRAFFVLPYRGEDQLATKSHFCVYAGVETERTRDTMEKLVIKSRVLNDNEPYHIAGPNVFHPLNLGRLVTPPSADASCWSTDRASSMVIKFYRADTLDLFVTTTLAEMIDDRRINAILVGREWIQFRDWTVDPDGLTVTFSTLLRGRNGSEVYIPEHVADEEVVFPTEKSFRPVFILNSRMQQNEPLSLRLSFAQDIQTTGEPTVFDSLPESVRPWAPGDIERFDNNDNSISFQFQYRGKYDDEDLLVAGSAGPTFEPSLDSYNRFKNSTDGAYEVKYVAYITTDGTTTYEETVEIMRNREEHLNFPFGFTRAESRSTIIDFSAGVLSGGGIDRDTDTLYVYIAQMGGPRNARLGLVARRVFPPGPYPVLPPQPSVNMHSMAAYVVLTPDSVKVLDLGLMVALKP